MRGVAGANAATHACDVGRNVAVAMLVLAKIWCSEQNEEINVGVRIEKTYGDDGNDDEAEHGEMNEV